jgi:hypothetical protein
MMSCDIFIDGKLSGYFTTVAGWDEAATWIEKHAPHGTPLRRLAEERKTYQSHEAAAMLLDLVRWYEPSLEIRHTLRLLHQWLLKGHHVMITKCYDECAF